MTTATKTKPKTTEQYEQIIAKQAEELRLCKQMNAALWEVHDASYAVRYTTMADARTAYKRMDNAFKKVDALIAEQRRLRDQAKS